MFDRFEDDCKRAMNEARKEAQRLGHGHLDAEHVLLGLLLVPGCTAVRMLQAIGLDIDAIRVQTLERMPPESEPIFQMPFTDRSKRVLELAIQQAGNLDDRYIGTEHLLLGLALLGERDASMALRIPLGVDWDRLRSVMDTVPRGERAPANRGKRHSLDPEDASADGTKSQRLFHAAQICDQVKEELIEEQCFEHASRARDVAHWIRQLAGELGGEPSS